MQSRSFHKLKQDKGQAILDACWSGGMIGDKVKEKILKQMNRLNKARQPLKTGRPKTSNRVVVVGKNSKGVLPVQDIECNFPECKKCKSTRRSISDLNKPGWDDNKYSNCDMKINDSEYGIAKKKLSEAYKKLMGEVHMHTRSQSIVKRQRRGRKERGKYTNADISAENECSITESINKSEVNKTAVSSKISLTKRSEERRVGKE